MLDIAVGTESALKLRAVEAAIAACGREATVRGVATKSGVPDQPVGLPQIEAGAVNRAREAKDILGAEIGIGIENGLVFLYGLWFDPPCVAIVTEVGKPPSIALGTFFTIPDWAVEQVQHDKTELGVVVQEHAGGGEKDPHKFFSNGTVVREEIIAQAVHSALCPVLFPDRYREP